MFDKNIEFIYPWRPYQKRVLDEIDEHLTDRKLHLIAPPGSGKTVLGLEVVRRLDKPALILSPGVTVRNQWITRFVELFSRNAFENYSFDLEKPAALTSSTYQALHSLKERKDLADILIAKGIEVIVLDEAHHLKSEWWKSLTSLLGRMKDITLISLTATPPYDSTPLEWERYMSLCGPVDGEISVPELVKEKNLCPHQDLIYYSEPTPEEQERLNSHFDRIHELLGSLVNDEELTEILLNHPALTNPESIEASIYAQPDYYASLLVFLNHRERREIKLLREFLGLERNPIPPLTEEWLEILFTHGLYKDDLLKKHPPIMEIRKKLKAAGAVEGRRVVLRGKEGLDNSLRSSLSKFRSIREIVDLEYGNLGQDLRMVVLTDYVRSEQLTGEGVPAQFGVAPIFRYLYGTNEVSRFDYTHTMALLSGNLTIIPLTLKDSFLKKAETYGIREDQVDFSLVYGQYVKVEMGNSHKHRNVSIVTELLTEGAINILIGTKSLLGEGWDCPTVNSLVLATFVGSYMLSNQMRGRAIRTYRENPDKTANIWHLLCYDRKNEQHNPDWQILEKRFQCFAGLDKKDNVIKNGIDRTGVNLRDQNRLVREKAASREELSARWFTAVNRYKKGRLVKETRTGRENLSRTFIFRKTLRSFFLQSLALAGSYTFYAVRMTLSVMSRNRGASLDWLVSLLFGASLFFCLVALPGTVKALFLLIRHGSPASSFRQMAQAVIDAMEELRMFSRPGKIPLETEYGENGTVKCRIHNVTPYEQSLFVSALSDLAGQVKNPRYLITRGRKFLLRVGDYHSVPEIFGRKKESALVFHKHWQKRMGKSRLIYTRRNEGRHELIKARSHSLSAHFTDKTGTSEIWKGY